MPRLDRRFDHAAFEEIDLRHLPKVGVRVAGAKPLDDVECPEHRLNRALGIEHHDVEDREICLENRYLADLSSPDSA